jgi:hypothetical protein
VIRIKKGDIVTTINGTYPWSSNNILLVLPQMKFFVMSFDAVPGDVI